MGQVLEQRYALSRPLGKGGQGTVWLADDRHSPGKQVAIKLLTGGEDQAAFWREYAYSARLRHPSLAMVSDVGLDSKGHAFIVSEYIKGLPFADWAQDRSFQEIIDPLACLLGALSFLHRRGVLHRDIKSENVLVTEQTSIKLVDFGLAVPLGTTPELSGTPAFMAPELFSGAPPSIQTDLYAVGMLLLRSLGGQSPANGPLEEVAEQTHHELEGLFAAGHLPGPLLDLVRQLVQRDPARRHSSAEALLIQLEEASLIGQRTAADYLAGDGLPTPTLIGRETLIETACVALDRITAESPRSSGLVFMGPSGAGGTRMCEELAHCARLRQIRIRWGIPVVREGLPSAGLDRDPNAERALAIEQAVQVLQHEIEHPLLLIIDPLSDPLERQIVATLLDQDSLPLCICATAHEEGADELFLGDFTRLGMEPLDRKQSAALIASMLPAAWATEDFCSVVYDLSGGSPQLATELTRVAVAQQLRAGGPVDLARVARQQEPTQLVRKLTYLSVDALTETQHELASLIALFPGAVSWEQLKRWQGTLFTALTEEEAWVVLETLLMQGVLSQDVAGMFRVRARTMADALLQRLAQERRQQLGEQLIVDLGGTVPVWERGIIATRCGLEQYHRGLMIQGARAARAALELPTSEQLYRSVLNTRFIADRQDSIFVVEDHELLRELGYLLLALGKMDQAVECFSSAVALSADSSAICALADAQLKAGRHDDALDTLERGGEKSIAAEVLVQRAKVLLFAGRYAEAMAAALKVPAETPPKIHTEALHIRGLAHYYLGDLTQAFIALNQAVEQAGGSEDPLARARLINSLALIHQRRSEFEETRQRYHECLEIARALQHLPFEATFLMNLGSVDQQLGEYAVALLDFEQSLEVARRFGGAREIAQVQHNLGRICMLLGQVAPARAYLQHAEKLCERFHWTSLQAHNWLVESELEMDAGKLAAALIPLERARTAFSRLGDARGAIESDHAYARWLLISGRVEEAWAAAMEVQTRADQMQMDSLKLRALLVAGNAELMRQAPRPRQAIAYLRQALRIAEDTREHELLVELHFQLHRALAAGGEEVAAEIQLVAARKLLTMQLGKLPQYLNATFRQVAPNPDVLAHRVGENITPGELPSTAIDARLFTAMLDINRELNAEPALQRLLERIIDHAVELAGAERGFLVINRANQIQIEVARNIDQETIRKKTFKISRSIADQVMNSGRPTVTIDAMDDRRFSEFLSVHNLRLRSIICVPLTIRRRVRGAIYLDNRFQAEAFGDRQVALLGALADQAALAISTWELMEQNRARQKELADSRLELEQVNQKLAQSMEWQQHRLAELTELTQVQKEALTERFQFDNLIGRSAAMQEVYRVMDRVKDSTASVYIYGASGTGKELVAKALHFSSKYKEGPFITSNCAAIPATLLESELFGYEKGAFTGADRRHHGLFERSHGGTLFLDEVGDTPPELQVKLLRVLQERQFTRLGGEHELGSDFRLITASNKNLEELVEKGLFRQDLLYRINVIRIHLPPLHQRREDIPLLANFLLRKHDGEGVSLSKDALRAMLNYNWPGNVRELENEIMRALAMGGRILMPDDFSPHLRQFSSRTPEYGLDGSLGLRQAVDAFEAQMVRTALARYGSVTEAAKQLGITRVGLHKLMRRLMIEKNDQ